MPQVTITINTANAAFGDDPYPELARIIGGVAQGFADYNPATILHDVNGSTVGKIEFDTDGPIELDVNGVLGDWFAAGQAAYAAELPRVPMADAAVHAALVDVPVGNPNTKAALKTWVAGWTAASRGVTA